MRNGKTATPSRMAGAVGDLKRPRVLMQPMRRARQIAGSLKTMRFRDLNA